jgi:hypothetical protein
VGGVDIKARSLLSSFAWLEIKNSIGIKNEHLFDFNYNHKDEVRRQENDVTELK